MKKLLHIFLLLTLFYTTKAQMLYYQDTYKGGVTSDGRSYFGFDFSQSDTINFQVHIATGSTIKKAFLLSNYYPYAIYPANSNNNIPLIFNGNPISIDSSDIISSYYNCGLVNDIHIVAKDITPYTLLSSNQLITPNQGALMTADTNKHCVYVGFSLIILYENNALPQTNAAIFLNSGNHTNPTTYSFSGLNPINNINDVGLSIWTNDVGLISDSISFTLNAANYLGAIYPTIDYGNENTLPGSFYYQNNTLFGLVDDTNSPQFHSTDAIANIKSYLPNNATNFTLNTNNSPTCMVNNFVTAYSTPCPARSAKDTTLTYNVCKGNSSVQLAVSSNTVNTTYSWYAADSSLNHYNIPTPIASPTASANYIVLVDSASCKHTEHFKVNVFNLPLNSAVVAPDSCAEQKGAITAGYATDNLPPYTYSIGGAYQSNPTFSNLAAGTYTLTTQNNMGCRYTQTLYVNNINPAHALIVANPVSGYAPFTPTFNNFSTGSTNYVWYANGNTYNAKNISYTFDTAGTYMVMMIAEYDNNVQCTDTSYQLIVVKPQIPDSFNITVPNIFSPNADGINETWQLLIYNYNYIFSNYQCNIYNRWGAKVFNSDNINDAWNGRTTSGMPCSAGTYFYTIAYKVTSSIGIIKEDKLKGFIELTM